MLNVKYLMLNYLLSGAGESIKACQKVLALISTTFHTKKFYIADKTQITSLNHQSKSHKVN